MVEARKRLSLTEIAEFSQANLQEGENSNQQACPKVITTKDYLREVGHDNAREDESDEGERKVAVDEVDEGPVEDRFGAVV